MTNPDMPVMIVRSQSFYHSPVYIKANKVGLLKLREAIDTALLLHERGEDPVPEHCFIPPDGESYYVDIEIDENDWQHESWQSEKWYNFRGLNEK
jgi:hypothetical protein